MKRNEPVTYVMTRDPLHVQRGQPVSVARKLMEDHGFHHVPVCHGKRLVGVISAQDILARSWGASDERALDQLLDHTVTTEHLMSKAPRTVSTKDTVRAAAELLSAGSFHAVPVVDENGDLAGIVTSTDLVRYLLEQVNA
jgi:CBS domain-containing protein